MNTNRRNLLELMLAAAVAPALISRQALASTPGGLIAPPAGTMRFRRSVVRHLAWGRQISVTRDFAIGFRQFADGFIVEGQQLSVDVAAPANLAAFAELERSRVETEMFPITLDPFGQIISVDPSDGRANQVDVAFGEALQQITGQPLADAERGELRQFIGALHQTGNLLVAVMPPDLFAPTQAERSENRALPLPTGDVGHVSSRFDAERDIQTGLMRRALREVMTEIVGDRRHTVEQWQLDPV